MIKIKSTYTPKKTIKEPYSNPNMAYIYNYWKREGNKFNYRLYLKVLEAKSKFL
jgi:hypothetical protein